MYYRYVSVCHRLCSAETFLPPCLAEDLTMFFHPKLYAAAALHASMIAMRITVSGNPKMLVDQAWAVVFESLRFEDVEDGANVFLHCIFRTTDKQLVARLFEYEQQQYLQVGNTSLTESGRNTPAAAAAATTPANNSS